MIISPGSEDALRSDGVKAKSYGASYARRPDSVSFSGVGFSAHDGSDVCRVCFAVLLACVEASVHGLEIGNGHARLDLRGLNQRMTRHFLQMTDRHAGPTRWRQSCSGSST